MGRGARGGETAGDEHPGARRRGRPLFERPIGSSPRSRWRSGSAPARRSRWRSSSRCGRPERLRARGRVPPHRGHHPRSRRLRTNRVLPERRRHPGVQRRHGRPPGARRPRRPPSDFVANASAASAASRPSTRSRSSAPRSADGPLVARSVVAGPACRLRAAQTLFDATGGLHAAAMFSPAGELRVLREDIGGTTRSTRSSATRCSPTSSRSATRCSSCRGGSASRSSRRPRLRDPGRVRGVGAVEPGRRRRPRLGQTLVGFLRGDRFVVYTHPHRLDLDS